MAKQTKVRTSYRLDPLLVNVLEAIAFEDRQSLTTVLETAIEAIGVKKGLLDQDASPTALLDSIQARKAKKGS